MAHELTLTTRWTATTAFATGPHPGLAEAADLLRRRGASRLVIAPWFLAHGKIIDRVAEFARAQRIPMSSPLGAHRQVAETVLDRFDEALAARGGLVRSLRRHRDCAIPYASPGVSRMKPHTRRQRDGAINSR